MMTRSVGINMSSECCSRTIKADYFKMGGANFLFHTKDGFTATGVMMTFET